MTTYPKINRGTHSNFYQNKGFFSLIIGKGRHKSENNILSFQMGEFTFSSVIVDRKEAANVLKKFKKEIDSNR